MYRSILAMLIALVSFTASADDRLNVAFINPGNEGQFWGEVAATMRAAADDLDIALEVIHTDRDRIRMVDAASSLASRADKPDYVIVVNELLQTPQLLRELEGSGIPVFELLNRMTPEQRAEYRAESQHEPDIVGSIVPDNTVAGYEMAWSVIRAARAAGRGAGSISMLALLGDAATPAALQREAGMRAALEEAGDVTLVRAFPVMWNQETAYERTHKLLQRMPVDTVWAANDQIAKGAQEAARENGYMPGEDTFFVGLNWSQGGLNDVAEGRMTLTHGGHFFAGAWSMVLLRDLHDGKLDRGSDVSFPMSAVDTSNVAAFQEHFAGRNWDAIDFSQFSCGSAGPSGYRFTAEAILKAAAGSS